MQKQIESANKIIAVLKQAASRNCLDLLVPVVLETHKSYTLNADGDFESLFQTICITVSQCLVALRDQREDLTTEQQDELVVLDVLHRALAGYFGE